MSRKSVSPYFGLEWVRYAAMYPLEILSDRIAKRRARIDDLHIPIICAIVFHMNPDRTDLTARAFALIDGSKLSDADKELLRGRLPYAPTMVVQLFVEVCEEDPFSVDALVMNLKKKLDAQGNLQKLHEIAKQDKRELEAALAN